jgi:hypothetical protein
MSELIPILVCFREADGYKRTYTTAYEFRCWRKDTLRNVIYLHTRKGLFGAYIPIIVTMNGFAYDKIYAHYTGRLLRERMQFNFDINKLPKL